MMGEEKEMALREREADDRDQYDESTMRMIGLLVRH